MATQDKNKISSEKDEHQKNKSSTSGKKNRVAQARSSSNNQEAERQEQPTGNQRNIPESSYGQGAYSVGHSQGETGTPYQNLSSQQNIGPSQEGHPFGDSANERQRVGHSSDQNWWDSGTNQQTDTFRGNTQYPYRENNWGRNQQGQAGIENLYPQEPASERQRQNFAEGSQYPYEGDYGAENLRDREGLDRAEEWKGPQQNINRGGTQRNGNAYRQTYGGENRYPYGENTGERDQQGPYEEQKGAGHQPFSPQNSHQQSYGGNSRYPYGGNYGERSPRGITQNQQKGPGNRNDITPAWVENQRLYKAAQTTARQDFSGRAGQDWPQQQSRNLNTETYKNQNTMRSDDRNFGREYNDNYHNEDYGRERSERRQDYRIYYGDEGNRGNQRFERDYEQGEYYPEQNFNRGYRENRSFGREQDYNRNYGRNEDFNHFDQGHRGQYHSSDQPGRGYNSESEMNRNSGNHYQDYGRMLREGNYSRGPENRAFSSHRATGPYDDFERDLDRYGIRENNGRNRDREQDQGAFSGRRNYDSPLSDTDRFNYHPDYQEREAYNRRRQEGNRSSYYDSGEENRGRRGEYNRMRDREREDYYRRDRGNDYPGRDQRPYGNRYDEGRGRY